MTPLTKGFIAVATLSTFGTGIGLTFHLLSDNSKISTKLISEGFELANSKEDWTKLFEAHELLKEPNDNVFKAESGVTKNKDWLENKCKNALNSNEKELTNYKLAKQWCVKEAEINKVLGKTRKILDSKTTTDDTNHWPKILENLKQNQLAISALGIQKTPNTAITIQDIKEKCTSAIAIKTTARDFNEKFELAKNWCSISKNNS